MWFIKTVLKSELVLLEHKTKKNIHVVHIVCVCVCGCGCGCGCSGDGWVNDE